MKLSLILFSFILISCATSSNNKKTYDEVKQEDFKKVKQVKYRKADDSFEQVESKYSEASNRESLQRIFSYDGDISLEGDLGRIAKLCYEKNFKDAEQLIKQSNQKYLKNPIFWNQVGTCFLLQKQRRKALLFYNKALAIMPDYAPSLNNLGVMYMHEDDYSRALIAFQKARKSKEFSRTPRINLANLYVNFGLYDQAIKELNALYNVSKTDVDVLNLLAVAYLMQNDIKSSLGYYKQIPKNFLEEPRFGINYSLALYLDNKEEDAKDVFEDINVKHLGAWNKNYQEVSHYLGVKK